MIALPKRATVRLRSPSSYQGAAHIFMREPSPPGAAVVEALLVTVMLNSLTAFSSSIVVILALALRAFQAHALTTTISTTISTVSTIISTVTVVSSVSTVITSAALGPAAVHSVDLGVDAVTHGAHFRKLPHDLSVVVGLAWMSRCP